MFNPYSSSTTSPNVASLSFESNGVCEVIGESAFWNCDGITNIAIPDNVTNIEESAFAGCDSLATVKFSENSKLESIGKYAFLGCGSLTSIGSVNSGSSFEIPNKVTAISDSMFQSCTGLTSVVLPDSVTGIGEASFYRCTGLSSIGNTDSDASFKIHSNLTSIGRSAFEKCTGLTKIVITEGIKNIGGSAFLDCTNISEIKFDAIEMADLSSNNYVFRNTGTATDGINVTIGKKVTKVPNSLFNPYSYDSVPTNIVYIEFENDSICQNIGEYSFCGCTNLETVILSSSVKNIGKNAFYNCSNLKTIKYNGILEDWCQINFESYQSNPCYYENEDLYINGILAENINITNTISTINKYAFYGCTTIKSITIPDSMTTIGNMAFYNCKNIVEINFNATQMSGLKDYNYVFRCAGIDNEGITVKIGSNVKKIPSYLFCPYSVSEAPNITNVVFEENSVCTSIDGYAFANCINLTCINLPSSITNIVNTAFINCRQLSILTVEDNNEIYYSINNCIIKKANKELFLGCKNSIIPDDGSVTSIGSNAFNGRTGFTNINIPNSITTINSSAFKNCTELTNIRLSENITAIGSLLFSGCESLTDIIIPSKVTVIDGSAFAGCTSLVNITIPKTVKNINNNSLSGCSAIQNINYLGTTEEWQKISFGTGWNNNTGEYIITCTDGTISKDGTVTPNS